VCGFVKEGGEDVGGGSGEPFTGDEDFGDAAVALPAIPGREMPEEQAVAGFGARPGPEDDDRVGELRVSVRTADRRIPARHESGRGELVTRTCHLAGVVESV